MPELDSQYRSKWLSVADKLAHQGSQVIDVSLPHFKYGVPCYNVVNCAEVVSNMAKYTGLIFGKLSSITILKIFVFISLLDFPIPTNS